MRILLLFICLSASAQLPVVPSVTQHATAGSPTYTLYENFETVTTGYDSGYSWTETPGTGGAIAHADTVDPLRGSQSCRINAGNSGQTSTTSATLGADLNEVWFHIEINALTNPPAGVDSRVFVMRNLGGSAIAELYLRAPGNGSTVQLVCGSANAISAGTWNTNTIEHIWGHYKNDGSGGVAVSASTTKPVDVTFSGGDQNTAVHSIYLHSENLMTNRFDQIIVNNASIGNAPP